MDAKNFTIALLAGGQPLFLKGLSDLLESEFGLRVQAQIFCEEDLESTIQKNNKYSWLFLDLDVFNYDYQSTLKRITRLCTRRCKVVLFTTHYSLLLKQKLEQLPISGLFSKNIAVKDLLLGLKCIAEGERIFSVSSKLNGSCYRQKESHLTEQNGLLVLSKREREILDLICKGFSTVEISEKLYISKFTVETHRKNILRKLELRSSTELVSYAYRKGWVY